MLYFQAFPHYVALVSTYIYYLVNVCAYHKLPLEVELLHQKIREFIILIGIAKLFSMKFVPKNIPASDGWILRAGNILT